MDKPKIHLGETVINMITEQERNLNWFAIKANYDRSNMVRLLEQHGFHTDWLIIFSEILQENCAKPLADFIDEHIIAGKKSPVKQVKIT